eukprot:788764-Alexandrium_andersonii.AAC.1
MQQRRCRGCHTTHSVPPGAGLTSSNAITSCGPLTVASLRRLGELQGAQAEACRDGSVAGRRPETIRERALAYATRA